MHYRIQRTEEKNKEHVTYDIIVAGEAEGFVVHCSACKGQIQR